MRIDFDRGRQQLRSPRFSACFLDRNQRLRHEVEVIGSDPHRAFVDLESVVDLTVRQHERRDAPVGFHRLRQITLFLVEIRELEEVARIVGLQVDQLLVDRNGGATVTALERVLGDLHVVIACVVDQSLLLVELGQATMNVHVTGIDPVDLLVDGDRFDVEPVECVLLGGLQVVANRILVLAQTHVEVTNAVERVGVTVVLVEYLLVLLDRRFDLALGHQLLGDLEDVLPE